jgi:hypothetical protein
MGFLVAILLIAVIFVLWRCYNKSYHAAKQSFVAHDQKTQLAIFYGELLYTLAERQQMKDRDYRNLVKQLYELDQWVFMNKDYRQHNEKWEGICKSLGVPVIYRDLMGYKWVSEEVCDAIAEKLIFGRDVFYIYVNTAERSRKVNYEK